MQSKKRTFKIPYNSHHGFSICMPKKVLPFKRMFSGISHILTLLYMTKEMVDFMFGASERCWEMGNVNVKGGAAPARRTLSGPQVQLLLSGRPWAEVPPWQCEHQEACWEINSRLFLPWMWSSPFGLFLFRFPLRHFQQCACAYLLGPLFTLE